MKQYLSGLFILTFIISSCQKEKELHYPISEEAHLEEIENWYNNRIESLKSENGWLNLIGLYWFEQDTNRLGTEEGFELLVDGEGFPLFFGTFERVAEQVYFDPEIEGIQIGDESISEKSLVFDPEMNFSPTISYNQFRVNVLQRSDLIGLRLRDLESETIRDFHGIDRFPVDKEWRFEAKFIPYEPAKEIPISNVLGQTYAAKSVGYLSFGFEGRVYNIDALEEGDQLFLIFADGTSGAETYGGGRYLYTQKADENGIVILDFNKAYNPPCVFTPFATCPLPPRQNILELAIEAGERNWGK
ncbi:DUF1684 domain-containing protein [Belliella sp. DSM 107340]|uniref:DUF1684 domain-containing protein n=1 Tax=Belliella calami TaxID=2923436 RepID=A0ABS9UL66_9BACT|nr:DUF1684 domain-containing protein [Belliella calami]MCH7396983.1 DUF1684 domain-containing protein [Belliella calami]